MTSVARAGFKSILLHGDTDFSQTQYLDGWDADNVRFVFGIDAMPNLVELAELKAWLALSLPETGRWASKHQAEKQNVLRMRFRTFVNAFVRVPCQIVRSSRRVVYRLLSWNRWQEVFFRAVDAVRKAKYAVNRPLRC